MASICGILSAFRVVLKEAQLTFAEFCKTIRVVIGESCATLTDMEKFVLQTGLMVLLIYELWRILHS